MRGRGRIERERGERGEERRGRTCMRVQLMDIFLSKRTWFFAHSTRSVSPLFSGLMPLRQERNMRLRVQRKGRLLRELKRIVNLTTMRLDFPIAHALSLCSYSFRFLAFSLSTSTTLTRFLPLSLCLSVSLFFSLPLFVPFTFSHLLTFPRPILLYSFPLFISYSFSSPSDPESFSLRLPRTTLQVKSPQKLLLNGRIEF